MKRQSLSKNLIFQFLYQGLILVIPLILSPYLTRTLQETALGIYSYSNSIAYYFVIAATLGISRHGQRMISQNAENEEKLRRTFWSLFTVHIIISLIVLIVYILSVLVFVRDNQIIYLIQGFYVASALFDITWLFYGLENFKSVVVKNTAVKVIECILIFCFVKSPADLWKYTLVSTLGLLIGQIVMIPQAIKIIPPIHFASADMKKHIKPLLVFSISVIAVSLYTVFDKTLLGLMTNKDNVAFYEYSNKIITIPKTIIGVVGTVMFPRACRLASKGDANDQRKYIDYSFMLTAIIGVGSMMGLIAIAQQFAVIYFGKSFAVCGSVMIALSPLIYIIGIGDIIRTQYMIPNHMDKQFNICILLNAFINIVISTLLIPIIGIYGAVLGTVSAELFGIVFQLMVCRKFIKLSEILKTAAPCAIAGLLMLFIIKILQYNLNYGIISLLIEIAVGACVYGLLIGGYLFLFQQKLWRTIFGHVRILKKK